MRLSRCLSIVTVCTVLLGPWALHEASAVSTDRGTWFFDVNHWLGSSAVVGNDFRENFTSLVMQEHNIARNYQSFIAPVPPPSATDIAAWHVELNSAGITPMLLLSDAVATANLTFFTDQLINYNSGRPANEQYAGVKLDLEPQASAAWSGGTNTDRRDMLNDLRDTFASIRAHLDANGEAATPIYADIPVWFDVTGSTIGWGDGVPDTPDQERDQWFTDIASSLDGLTLMAFGTTSFATVEANSRWEITNFGADVRIGLDVNDFPSLLSLTNLATQIEDFYAIPANNPSSHTIGIDFQDFAQLADISAPEPQTAVLSMIGLGVIVTRLFRRRGGQPLTDNDPVDRLAA